MEGCTKTENTPVCIRSYFCVNSHNCVPFDCSDPLSDICTGVRVESVFVEHAEVFRSVMSMLQNDSSVDSHSELDCMQADKSGVLSDDKTMAEGICTLGLYLFGDL